MLESSDFEQEKPRELSPEEIAEQRASVAEAAAGLEMLAALDKQGAWKIFQRLMNERVQVTAERISNPAEPHVLAHLSGQLLAYRFVATWFADQAAEFKRTLTQNGNTP